MAARTGAVILGGGLIKHHICNANLMRNGADYAVYVNTANEWDGSDAGRSGRSLRSVPFVCFPFHSGGSRCALSCS